MHACRCTLKTQSGNQSDVLKCMFHKSNSEESFKKCITQLLTQFHFFSIKCLSRYRSSFWNHIESWSKGFLPLIYTNAVDDFGWRRSVSVWQGHCQDRSSSRLFIKWLDSVLVSGLMSTAPLASNGNMQRVMMMMIMIASRNKVSSPEGGWVMAWKLFWLKNRGQNQYHLRWKRWG